MSSFPVGAQKLWSYGMLPWVGVKTKYGGFSFPCLPLSSHILSRGRCVEYRKDKWSREMPCLPSLGGAIFTGYNASDTPGIVEQPMALSSRLTFSWIIIQEIKVLLIILFYSRSFHQLWWGYAESHPPTMAVMVLIFQINQHTMKESLFISNHCTFNSGFISNENLMRKIRSP